MPRKQAGEEKEATDAGKAQDEPQPTKAASEKKNPEKTPKKKSRSFLGVLCRAAVRGAVIGLVMFGGSLFMQYRKETAMTPVNDKNCKVLKGYYGLEDVQFSVDWPGIAFATSDPKDYRFMLSKINEGNRKGAILKIDFNQETPKLEEVRLDLYPHKDFHPHGMYILDKSRSPGDMSTRMLVVNHRASGESLEHFAAMGPQGMRWVWLSSVTHPLFTGINDVVMIDSSSFYVTNFLNAPLKYGLVEDIIMMAPSQPLRATKNIVYCNNLLADNIHCTVALANVDANGIVASMKGDRVYVRNEFHVDEYARDRKGKLTLLRKVSSHVTDNLNMDGLGNLFLASPAQGLYLLPALYFLQWNQFGGSNMTFMSEVVRVDVATKTAQETVLYRGNHLTCLSSADVWQNTLIAGSVFDEGLLVCKL